MLIPRERLVVWKAPLKGDPGNPSRANARFELVNQGAKPVQIISVESGCGYAKPVVRPDRVAPGQVATVDVSALAAPVGEKDVPITIHTDSPVQPEIVLILRVIGTRKPPFLFQFRGDLSFRGRFSADLTRTIAVLTVEPLEPSRRPILSTSLPFFEFEEIGVEAEPYSEPGVVLRERTYLVHFKEAPPSGAFTGQVVAQDPWDPGTFQSLNVVGRFDSDLTVAPQSITLGPGRAQATLLVMTREPISDLEFEVEQEQSTAPRIALEIRREDSTNESKKVHQVIVSLAEPSPSASGRVRLRVRQPGASEGGAIVPVAEVAE